MRPDGRMDIEYQMTDPKNWEGEWKMTKTFSRRENTDITEVQCLPDLNDRLPATQIEEPGEVMDASRSQGDGHAALSPRIHRARRRARRVRRRAPLAGHVRSHGLEDARRHGRRVHVDEPAFRPFSSTCRTRAAASIAGASRWAVRNRWRRAGWRSNIIKAGDKVTVVVNPLKSGEFGGIFVSMTLADGRKLGGRAIDRQAPLPEPVADQPAQRAEDVLTDRPDARVLKRHKPPHTSPPRGHQRLDRVRSGDGVLRPRMIVPPRAWTTAISGPMKRMPVTSPARRVPLRCVLKKARAIAPARRVR